MRIKKWKSFLCICTSCSLLMSMAAWAAPVVVTPLEESQVASFQSGNSPSGQGSVSSQGPGGGTGIVSSDGPTSSTTSPSQGSSSGPSQDPSSGQGQTPSSGPVIDGTGSNSAVSPGTTGGNAGTAGNNTAAGTVDAAAAATVQKPEIASEGAVLMDAATGTVLFSKNGDKQFYPASITKLMTALLVAENCGLDDKVTFSSTATTNLESGAVSINMTEGDVMTVRQCLYALLLKSANEVGNALAEHVGGSNAKFAEMMNAKAAALGCTNTHFTNPHGLNDTNHYTTPHDMALIARAAFQNDVVKTVASTRTYTLPATIKNPSGLTVTMGHKMLNPKDSRYYQGVIGGKTGYTSKAGNTLVTAVEQDGVRFIAVIMKSKSTHYTDTKALFDYGYQLVKAGAISGAGSTGGTESTGGAGGTASTGNAGPGASSGRGWVQDGNGWYYVKDNEAKASNEWITVGGESYWIDSNTYMAKGWRQINGKWYFLRSNGAMARNQWEKVEENGQWFYLGQDGAMLTNTTTPDGYKVDESGACM